jgi:hypothetical protein
VLPTVAPDLDYGDLDEVQDGVLAQVAYEEAIAPATSAERRETIRRNLLRYCERDTLAMVRLVEYFQQAPCAVAFLERCQSRSTSQSPVALWTGFSARSEPTRPTVASPTSR